MNGPINDIPVIETARLVLRAPELSDLAPLAAFFETEDSHFVGGPMSIDGTHRAMLSTIGSWALHGFGLWHIAEQGSNRFVGWSGLLLTYGKPEPGFAWTVLPGFQGNGMATEAASAALSYVRGTLGHSAPATYIAEDNPASLRVASKLGFRSENAMQGELTLRFDQEAYA